MCNSITHSMQIQQTLSQLENDTKIRSQVVLTSSLKRVIEAKKRLTGETLSCYLRKAACLRILAESEEKKELENLAENIVGSVSLKNHPQWKNKKKLQEWIKDLRKGWQ